MDLFVKRFEELSVFELYEICKLRVDVFVVEQECAYRELDGFDPSAVHVFIKEDEKMVAYLRVLPQNTVFEAVSLGRVIAVKRRMGYGTEILRAGIEIAKRYFKASEIIIEAQTYARGLYEKQGFVQISEEFLEDGIPHIKMRLYSGEG